MKAHIIPQSYLKGFVDPDTPDGQSPFLHLYDFTSSSWSRKAPNRALWQTNFYALPGLKGEEKDALDHGPMSQIEQRAEQLTREKIVPRLALTAQEKRDYAEFIALMLARVPAHRALMDRIVNDIATTPMKLLALHHPERYRRMAEAYERETGRKAPTIEDWTLMDEGKLTLRATQYEHLNGMAGVMDVVPDVLARMQWTFFHVAAPDWLITSDNPISLRVPDHPEWGFGLRRRDIQILFPITRTMGLLAVWSENHDHHIDLPAAGDLGGGKVVAVARERASGMNMLQIGHATQQIAAPSQHFPGEDWLEQKADLPQLLYLAASEMGADAPASEGDDE